MTYVSFLKLGVGILMLALSLGYMYHPEIILRINNIGRKTLFNDSNILLFRRRIGMLLLILGSLLTYMGFIAINRAVPEAGSTNIHTKPYNP